MEVDQVLESPVSIPVMTSSGKILGNLSTADSNGKERPMVRQALCWALYPMWFPWSLTTLEQEVVLAPFYRRGN